MKVYVNGYLTDIIIEKKRIKNTYIRVKKDLKIYVSTNYFTSDLYIKNLIKDNMTSIEKMMNSQIKRLNKSLKFFYLGKEYKVVITNIVNKPTIDEDFIYVKKKEDLEKFLNSEAKRLLPSRVKIVYEKMSNDSIPFPRINIRKMTRKWGYCNKKDKLITLNKELIKYDVDDIDYVIVHELCHFIHFNHSKAFWDAVKYYKSDYKVNKRHLKEE